MTRRSFAQELEEAADKIGDVSRADLQIMIRRAALRLRNSGEVTFDPEIDAVIDTLAAESEMQRSDVIRTIIKDWMISAGRLPLHEIDEDGKTDGSRIHRARAAFPANK